tara:strand:- start:94 stop:549 length:456 start_codon:yes stop_codon:yes gene_type:complete
MPKTKKEKWMDKERERLLEQHYGNLKVIEQKETIVSHSLHRIGLLHRSVDTLSGQAAYFNGAVSFNDEDNELMAICEGDLKSEGDPAFGIACKLKFGMKVLMKEQERYAHELVQARKDIDAIGGDAAGSYQIYEKASTDEVLSKKYDQENS